MVIVKTKTSEKRNIRATLEALELLRVAGAQLYQAAYPNYPGNFSRDSIIYGMLSGDRQALRAQIAFSAKNQGIKVNPLTGEEPGKIHHELPEVILNNKSAAYNACDTTALFLLAIASLYESGDENILDSYIENIESALCYIKSHIRDGLFYEDPAKCGASKFALKVTYWKDSQMNDLNAEPRYPIVYTLAHFQNADAVEAIGRALGNQDLLNFSNQMIEKGFDSLWKVDHFIVALDGYGNEIDPVSSDSLHSLLYINPDYIPDGHAQKVQKYMEKLQTKAGYLSGIACKGIIDDYHTRYIWTHEQALLHAASKKHSLDKGAEVCARVNGFIDLFPELIDPTDGFKPAGNHPQLWTVGARQYFENPARSLL
jgi:hypothetical protein